MQELARAAFQALAAQTSEQPQEETGIKTYLMPLFEDIFPGGVDGLRELGKTGERWEMERFEPFKADPGSAVLIKHSSGTCFVPCCWCAMCV